MTEPISIDPGALAVPDRPELGGSMKWVFYGALAVFSALFVFASFAPLAGGALAPGVISPDGSRRVVQHLEGGIISRILVRDGDMVSKGDPLLTLNETQRLADRNIARSRQQTLQVMEARLEAEQLSRRKLVLPFEIAADDSQMHTFAKRQQTLLDQSLGLIRARGSLFSQRSDQISSEITGLDGSITSLHQQRTLLAEEISGAEILTEKGLYSKPRLLALKREDTNLEGQIASAQAGIARLQGQISEIGVQRIEMETQRQADLARELAEIKAELVTIQERLIAAEDVLSRTIVRAPIDGQVMALRYQTIGGVIRPGEAIVDIVPRDERLIIEARVLPTDIDIVRPGQTAKITFSALRRSLPQFEGTVMRISADTIIDERTGQSFYAADIEVSQADLDLQGIGDSLTAGMPADVMIETESRTVLQYLIQPFSDSFRKGMRESNNAS